MGLAPHAAVWHLFLPQTLGSGTAERLRLAVVELHPYCPELWGTAVPELGTGEGHGASRLPCLYCSAWQGITRKQWFWMMGRSENRIIFAF